MNQKKERYKTHTHIKLTELYTTELMVIDGLGIQKNDKINGNF